MFHCFDTSGTKCVEFVNEKTIQRAIGYAKGAKWYEMKTITDPEIDIEELPVFRSVKVELIVHNKTVLLRNDKLIIPKALGDHAIKLGNQGVVKTKSYI